MKKAACLIYILVLLAACPAVAAEETPSGPQIVLLALETDGNVFRNREVVQGQTLAFQIRFAPLGVKPADFSIQYIQLITSTDINVFPFDVINSSYFSRPGEDWFDFNMRCRGDAPSNQFYTIPFLVNFDAYGLNASQQVDVSVLVRPSSPDSGGSDDGESGGAPKITITGYKTAPETVIAGEEFDLTVTIKNNGRLSANNMKCTYSAGAEFTAVSGASSFFISSVSGGASVSQKIELKVKATTAPGSYNINFSFTYDVPGYKDPVTDSETLAIPIVQLPKIQIGEIQLDSAEVTSGNEVNVMVTVSNVGKTTLYNVNAVFREAGGLIAEYTKYVGNINPGESVSIDEYLQTLGEGEATLVLHLSFEDEESQSYLEQKQKTLTIIPRTDNTGGPYEEEILYPEAVGGSSSAGLFMRFALGAVLLGGGAAAVLVVLSRKKKKRLMQERDRRHALALEQQYLSEQQRDPVGPGAGR